MHRPPADTRAPWTVTAITLFPELFPGPLDCSLVGQALHAKVWTLETIDLRAFGIGRHRKVDDAPAGGGAGMVLRADVVCAAVDAARERAPDAPLIYLSPRGRPFDQQQAYDLATGPGVVLLAGRFEGLDERAIQARGLREISIGDYVLSGGEIAAMVLIDACVRLLPGVVGGATSLDEESFEAGLLEYPQYTKPRTFEGYPTPTVLMSGDHGQIARWRREQALAATRQRRPDLLKRNKAE